jgi:hypothetical protein
MKKRSKLFNTLTISKQYHNESGVYEFTRTIPRIS